MAEKFPFILVVKFSLYYLVFLMSSLSFLSRTVALFSYFTEGCPCAPTASTLLMYSLSLYFGIPSLL